MLEHFKKYFMISFMSDAFKYSQLNKVGHLRVEIVSSSIQNESLSDDVNCQKMLTYLSRLTLS